MQTQDVKNIDRLPQEEIEAIAVELHDIITDGRATLLEEYITLAKHYPVEKLVRSLGYWKIKAIQTDSRFSVVLHEEIYAIIKNINSYQVKNLPYSPEEDHFIKINAHRGGAWLSKKTGRGKKALLTRAAKIGVHISKVRNGTVFHRYTPLQDDMIREHINKEGPGWLAKKLDVKRESIIGRAKIIGITYVSSKKEWTEEEIAFLQSNYKKDWKWIAEQLGVSFKAVKMKMWRMGFRTQKAIKNPNLSNRYSKEKDEFIRQNAEKGSQWISEQLGVSNRSVRRRANCLKILLPICRSDHKQYTLFSEADDEFIRCNANKGSSYIAYSIGKTRNSVTHRAKKLGVKLKAKTISSCERDKFIRKNASKGAAWLSKKIGISKNSVRLRARKANIEIPILHSKYKKPIYRFSKEDDALLIENAHMGYAFLSKKLNKSSKQIANRAKILGVQVLPHYLGTERLVEYKFIKENAHRGTKWLADEMNISRECVRQRAKNLGVYIPPINTKGKLLTEYSKAECNFIRENSHKGYEYLARGLKRSKVAISAKARNLGVPYPKMRDQFVVKNAHRGYSFLSQELGIKKTALYQIAKRLNLQVPSEKELLKKSRGNTITLTKNATEELGVIYEREADPKRDLERTLPGRLPIRTGTPLLS